MAFVERDEDVFFLSGPELVGIGRVALSESRENDAGSVVTEIHYVSRLESNAKVHLTWHALNAVRRRRGEAVDLTIEVTRSGQIQDDDLLTIRFPLRSDIVDDPVFATIGAMSFKIADPNLLLGAELGFGSETGLSFAPPFRVKPVSHLASAFRFEGRAQPYLEIRFHMRATEAPIVIRLGRVFAGMSYDPYIYNPSLELFAHRNGRMETPGAADVIAQFETDAQDAAKQHYYGGMQSFIRPFIVPRIGRPTFPMLIGTPNSISWYAIEPWHGIEMYEDHGLVHPDDVVLDCGAHAGQMSTLFGLISGRKGRVITFDPFPQNYFQVEAQARLNNLNDFVSTRAGVAETRREMDVSINGQAIWAQDRVSNDQMSVPLVPLDDFVSDKPTFIKLDIEGAEVFALQGAQKLMRECKPRIFAEIHTEFLPNFGHTLKDLFDTIPQDIYDIRVIAEGIDEKWRAYDSDNDVNVTVPFLLRAEPRVAS